MLYTSAASAIAVALAGSVYAQSAAASSPVASVAPAPIAAAADERDGPQLDDIIVTAQRRSTDLQDTAAAISAFGGAALEEDRVLSFEDLAGRATSLSFTALSPLDQEFNVRGITNTRLDSPTADQSIGIFFDDVYVGRSGLFNFDLYDIDRVEVIRGPQGVLLGRNVVGGAISIYSALPKAAYGGSLNASYGNYDEKLVKGHVTGAIADGLNGRFAFQVRQRDGLARDIAHNIDLDNVDSVQMRGQLQYKPDDSDFSARLIVDYTKDKSNGFHSLALDGPAAGAGPWSSARALVAARRPGGLSRRESLPDWNTYKGDVAPTPQELDRRAYGITLNLEKELGGLGTLTSITGYRNGRAYSQYDQTGIGPSNAYGISLPLLFRSPVRESERIKQLSQEFRIVSPEVDDHGFDWILGVYGQHDKVRKNDTISFEILTPPLPTLNGESAWDNRGKNRSYAVFGQLGYRFSEQFRVVGGLRYTKDRKSGVVTGLSVETGDKFNPNDPIPSSPLSSTFREGGGYTTAYKNSWSQLTPQATAEFKINKDILIYGTYSSGYKGGGFEDDPANALAAQSSYDPETVDSFEIGSKIEVLRRRVRLNLAVFSMKYKNLQVTQTSQICLCNITDNAANAKIKGLEAELTVAAATGLNVYGGLTLLDTKYIDFTDSVGNVNDGKFLQRTPHYQWNIGADFTTDLGSWKDGFTAHVNYNKQGKLSWNPEAIANEKPYGLVDGRLTLTPNEGKLSVSVWARNLADKFYRTNVIAFFGDEVSRLGTPRTFGAEIAIKF